jgi:Uma2 family endonuclease
MNALDIDNPIHRISVDQFHRMIEAGCFGDGDRVELLDGEMRDMPPIGPPHGGSTNTLNAIFTPALAGRAIVSVQGPLVMDDGTELYPDLSLLKYREDRYRKVNPTGKDVYLVVEVADSSLAYDTRTKLAKYARAGIRRYWVVDLKYRCVHDYRDPDRIGRRYRMLHTVKDGEVGIETEDWRVTVPLAELFGD